MQRGIRIKLAVTLSSVTVDDTPWVIAAIGDKRPEGTAQDAGTEIDTGIVTSEPASAVGLSDSEEIFRLAFEDNMTPMIFTDLEDRIVTANDAFCLLIGRTRGEILGNDSKSFTHPDDVGITEDAHRRVTRGDANQVHYVQRYLHKGGRLIVVEVSKSAARNASGKTLCYIVSQRDITDRTRRDHVLELRTEVNKLAIIASSEAEFMQQLCDVLVSKGGYMLAWIGVTSSGEEDGVDIVCAAGATGYLYGEMVSWWGSKESGLGPTGSALRTLESQVVNDLANQAMYGPWRERASQFGFGSSAALPFTFETQRSVLNIYARDVFAFDKITMIGLEEIRSETEFAIVHVRSMQQNEAALARLTLANNALIETEQRFRLAFEDNMAPMIFTNLENHVIAANDAFCHMIGYDRAEILGRGTAHFTHPEDVEIVSDPQRRLLSGAVEQVGFVKRYISKDGQVIVISSLKSAARNSDGEILYFVSSQRNITEERALADQLSHQALHDPLTGLANRALFEDRLSQTIARIERHGGLGAVLLLDLDDFKGVNDTYGHLIGDQLLIGIARRLELVTRSADTLCRFGGDEFLYLAEGLTSPTQADEVADRLLEVLTEPFSFNGIDLVQHASIGVVVCDGVGTNDRDYVQEADVALYEAKRLRSGRHLVFNSSMQQKAISRFSLIQELRHAFQAGELSMHYQPIVDLSTVDVVGFEALMRWQHPERGSIPPDVFIPLAEQSDLILELGSFAMREAVAATRSWEPIGAQGTRPFLTVNFSAHQFHNPGLISMIEGALSEGGMSPERLIIEITESVALLNVTETINTVSHLSRIGVGLALDDFGTGYSSLSYLALLLPRIIKIDRSFVSPELESEHNSTLLEAIVSLGHKLHTIVLAEGIETQKQLERLRNLDCQLGQGFLFSPAVPASDVQIVRNRLAGK
jgi:diguanylate cyclase (GGDEF)-like protein/PAS domain S-box-containing protein